MLSLHGIGLFLTQAYECPDAKTLSARAVQHLDAAGIPFCILNSLRFYRREVFVSTRFEHAPGLDSRPAAAGTLSEGTTLEATLRTAREPFFWSIDDLRPELEENSAFLAYLYQERLAGGAGVPIFGSAASMTTVLFAFDEPARFTPALPGLVSLALILADQFKRVLTPPDEAIIDRHSTVRSQALSPRESEIITWIALGKSSWETGRILSISEHTVNQHIENVVRKLGARNRTEAVTRALLIHKLDLGRNGLLEDELRRSLNLGGGRSDRED